MSLSGCASVGGGKITCNWSKPITTSSKDMLTDITARQILTHNTSWEKFCV
jgi:hypothetical protein